MKAFDAGPARGARASVNARTLRALGAAALLVAATLLSACLSPQQKIVNHEDNLAAAGFVIRPANTPERQAMLQRLPAHHFVQHVNGDNVRFIYADPSVCNCLYVGSQQAYDQYKRDQKQKNLADEQQMNAALYSDAAWNWGAWGPWGPEYGFRDGLGFGW